MKLNQLLLFVLIGLLPACQQQEDSYGQTATSTIDGRKIYRHSEDGKPTSLDPIKASTLYSNMMAVNIFDTLYAYKYLKRPYELKPNLAEAMPEISADGLTYTIKIKPQVYFTDHKSFNEGTRSPC